MVTANLPLYNLLRPRSKLKHFFFFLSSIFMKIVELKILNLLERRSSNQTIKVGEVIPQSLIKTFISPNDLLFFYYFFWKTKQTILVERSNDLSLSDQLLWLPLSHN